MNNIELLESMYTSIALLSSNEFSEKIRNIVKAEHNVYGIETEMHRLDNILQILKTGTDQKNLIEIVEQQKEEMFLPYLMAFQNAFNKIDK